jgi:hypothetical protein
VIRLTREGEHTVSSGRSWNYQAAFAADDDVTGAGTVGRQVYLFSLFQYDCQNGLTGPGIPRLNCPSTGAWFTRVTSGAGSPDHPSVDEAIDAVTFDADGTFGGQTGPAGAHRQIYVVTPSEGTSSTAADPEITRGIDGDSTSPSLNFDAQVVVFESTASLLGSTAAPGVPQIYANVASRGAAQAHLVQITNGRGPSTRAVTNREGTAIAFQSSADLSGDGHDTGITQIFVATLDRTADPTTVTVTQITHGNGPSLHPFIAAKSPVVLFDSTATDLPGGKGDVGSHVFAAQVPTSGPTTIAQYTTADPFGDCEYPTFDTDDNRIGFLCTGDPLNNGSAGNRAFVFDTLAGALLQITSRGDVKPPLSMSTGHHFILVADTADLSGAPTCEHQLELLDYFPVAGHWVPASQRGQLPPDAAVSLCGGPATPTTTPPVPRTTTTLSSTTTTVRDTVPSTTSTSVPPCASARCQLEAALGGGPCAGQFVPGTIVEKIERALAIVEAASRSPAGRGRHRLRRAEALLREAMRAAGRASHGRRAMLPLSCGESIRAAIANVLTVLTRQ